MEKRTLPTTKTAIGVSVYNAARDRIAKAFDTCEKVYVSFSGGKDYTTMLHMVADEAKTRGRKFGVMVIDLEAQYNLTIDHILNCREMYPEADWFWVAAYVSYRFPWVVAMYVVILVLDWRGRRAYHASLRS